MPSFKSKDGDGKPKYFKSVGSGTDTDPIQLESRVELVSAIPAGNNTIGNINIASFPADLVQANQLKVSQKSLSDATDSVSAKQSGSWQVTLLSSAANIGNVGIASFPATLIDANQLKVSQRALSDSTDTVGAKQSGTWQVILGASAANVGKVEVSNFPAAAPLPTGTNNIGNVGIASFPTTLIDTNRLKIIQIETVNPTFATVNLTTLNFQYSVNIANAKCFSFRVVSGSANIRYAYEPGKVVNSIMPIYPLENGVEESENFAGARFTGTLYLARDSAGSDAANTVVVFKIWS